MKFLILATLFSVISHAQNSANLPLSTYNYLQPPRDTYIRNPAWPVALTFQYQMFSDADMRELLETHSWRITYRCYGQPVFSSYLVPYKAGEGVELPGFEYNFGPSVAHRTTFRYPDAEGSKEDAKEDFDVPYTIAGDGYGWFRITFEDAPPFVISASLHVMHVQETGETVIDMMNFSGGHLEPDCVDGKPVHGVMLPLNNAIM